MELLSDSGILHLEHVMGTTVTLDVRDRHLHRGELANAVLAGVKALHSADRLLSTYRPDSAVSRLRSGGSADLPDVVVGVLVRCAVARERTRGWFDPWAMPGGFDPTGLVKGWAAQSALREMTRWGVRHGAVDAGGDVVTVGDASGAGDGSGWTIGIQSPFSPSGLLTTVQVRNAAVATAGAYGRGALAVDPTTSRPVHRLASASVLGGDAALADACATGASAHGPGALRWLEEVPGVEALLVTLDGELLRTRGWPDAA